MEVVRVLPVPVRAGADPRDADGNYPEHGGSQSSHAAYHCPLLRSLPQGRTLSFTQPGVYYANPQPNLEDISNHHVKKGNGGKEKKIVSEQIRQEMEDVILEPQPAASPPPKAHKKTSI